MESGRGKYTMAFHEDDLLGAEYIAAAVGVLEGHRECGFVACDLKEFEEEPSAEQLNRPAPEPAVEVFASGADFVRSILRGVEPMFGSIVYRRAALEDVRPHHEAYATLVDRPFLLSVIKRGWTAAVIHEPLAWYRRHGHGDTRHLAMSTDNILRLLRAYRRWLPERWTRQDRALFYSYTGYGFRVVSIDAAGGTAPGLALLVPRVAHGPLQSARARPARTSADSAGHAESDFVIRS